MFVDTNPKHERIAVLKTLSQLDDDDTNVFKSLTDRYQHRPQQLSSMCLAEFAATYVTKYRPDESVCGALQDLESDSTSTQLTLSDGFGKLNNRKQQAVIRFREYNKDTNWYRAKLMLYYPWFDEQADILGGYPSQLNPTNMHRFATSGIEAVSATVKLQNDENLQIGLLYRSPSVPQTTFITLLTRLLTHVTLCATPCRRF